MPPELPFLHSPAATYPALALAGLIAGALNVVAGGGSFLTLPILIFLGLPAGVANGTNRVGILLQNVAAVWSFRRQRVLDPPEFRRLTLAWAALPATLGAALGTGLALRTSDAGFERVLALLMVAISLVSFWTPSPGPRGKKGGSEARTDADPGGEIPRGGWPLAASFFAVGVYGGFVQAGVGFLILAASSALAGLDLVRGNAVKVVVVFCFTALSLALFASRGMVSWPHGLALASGTAAGGALGARLTVLKGHRWLRAAVTASILVFALLLWLR
ncbi:MAG: sulfite exporter TauE/SafE family protein [Acidobacteriota bacterium]